MTELLYYVRNLCQIYEIQNTNFDKDYRIITLDHATVEIFLQA